LVNSDSLLDFLKEYDRNAFCLAVVKFTTPHTSHHYSIVEFVNIVHLINVYEFTILLSGLAGELGELAGELGEQARA